jgi:hypothetical protein
MGINTVDKRKEEAQSFPVRLREFLLHARDRANLICVFEGQDHLYYGPRIDHYARLFRRVNLRMGGKARVLQLHALREHNKDVANAHAIYFVDRDYGFDNPATDRFLYITPHYSVENFYVQETVIGRVLTDCFELPPHAVNSQSTQPNAEHQGIASFVTKALKDFNDQLGLYLNAFALADRETRQRALDLSRFDREAASAFYEITVTGFILKRRPTYIELCLAFRVAPGVVDEAAFNRNVETLMKKNLLCDGRGKFILPPFALLVGEIWSDSKRTVPKHFSAKRPPKQSFSIENALGDLSRFAETPECLRVFLGNLTAPA